MKRKRDAILAAAALTAILALPSASRATIVWNDATLPDGTSWLYHGIVFDNGPDAGEGRYCGWGLVYTSVHGPWIDTGSCGPDL